MPPGIPNVQAVAVGAATVPSQTETVIGTTLALSTFGLSQRVSIAAAIVAKPNNVDVLSLAFKVRRGSLTGAQVGATVTANMPADAGGTADNPFVLNVVDTPGEVTGQTYVLTVATIQGAGTLAVEAGGAITTTVF